MVSQILDQHGQPMALSSRQHEAIAQVRAHYAQEFRKLRASYDATRDGMAFANHWANADNLSPNSVVRSGVRRKIRSRSRFEVIENNPYLKGMILTMTNDFTGSGPKLQVTDDRLKDATRRFIEREYSDWMGATKYRQKLWRKRIAKCVDGESFKFAYLSPKPDVEVPINYLVIECDQCTSEGQAKGNAELTEVDGIKFGPFEEPTEYFLLDQHPGGSMFAKELTGSWHPADRVCHWYRRDRSWLRGIPETAPSLPLCALLRRYTLAVVKAAEWAAAATGVLKTKSPPGSEQWSENVENEDAFDTFPIEHGMFNVLPWDYEMSQLDPKQPSVTYDSFVNALLREIARPILVPFNIASGSSAEASMSSAVVDSHIYKEGGRLERLHSQEEVCDPDFKRWYEFARLIPGYLPRDARLLPVIPRHEWHWDRIALDHTDPSRVADAVNTWHEGGHLTDRDIQETYFNRDVDDWRDEIRKQIEFREEVGLPIGGGPPASQKQPGEPGDNQADDGEQGDAQPRRGAAAVSSNGSH